MLERLVARGQRAINRKDLAGWMNSWADDAVFEFPGRTPISGRFVGKPAIESWWRRFFERMDTVRFRPLSAAVANPFALLFGTTTMFVHVAVELTTTDGLASSGELVSVTRLRRGKIVHVRDYFFDPAVEEVIWGRADDGAG